MVAARSFGELFRSAIQGSVHQSVVVVPHWHVRGDAQGRWSVTMSLAIDTALEFVWRTIE